MGITAVALLPTLMLIRIERQRARRPRRAPEPDRGPEPDTRELAWESA